MFTITVADDPDDDVVGSSMTLEMIGYFKLFLFFFLVCSLYIVLFYSDYIYILFYIKSFFMWLTFVDIIIVIRCFSFHFLFDFDDSMISLIIII